MSEVTQILAAIDQGNPAAAEQLLPLVYEELRKLAVQKMAQEQPGHTLQPTALVHEAYVRLVDNDKVQQWNSRGHFFAAAAEAMRRILIDHAREKNALKHGGDWQRLPFSNFDLADSNDAERWLLLDDALTCFEKVDEPATKLAKLHLFAGLSVDEAASLLGISRATAFRQWTYARAWLQARLQESNHPE